ncbi:hypothetical protein ACEQ8H_008448 [Pleosporales sp. CAS-2024a]
MAIDTLCRAAPRLSAAVRCPCHALQQRLRSRHASTLGAQCREQYRKSPVLFPFAVTVILAVSGMAAFYVPWYYRTVIQKPYHNFPEPVARKLRKAIFYSRGQWLDIREANKHFRQALALATEMGMDPFSDDIMGVKYAIATLFEDAGYYSLAVDVLEIMRHDCQRWVDDFSHGHWNNGNRSRVMKNMVQINVKLAQLYDTRYVNEPDNGEKRLVEAVEMALREKQRRDTQGLKTGEGPWLTDDEMGGTLEGKSPPAMIRAVVLMNNISTCLAQQSPPSSSADGITMSTEPTHFPVTNSPPRAVLIEQARQWATKALALASTIKGADRSEECDVGCAVATHNLGEFLEMEGNLTEARRKYEEAASLAKSIGFAHGQTCAREGLKRVWEMEKKKG